MYRVNCPKLSQRLNNWLNPVSLLGNHFGVWVCPRTTLYLMFILLPPVCSCRTEIIVCAEYVCFHSRFSKEALLSSWPPQAFFPGLMCSAFLFCYESHTTRIQEWFFHLGMYLCCQHCTLLLSLTTHQWLLLEKMRVKLHGSASGDAETAALAAFFAGRLNESPQRCTK